MVFLFIQERENHAFLLSIFKALVHRSEGKER
jgi:hypothetical protein